MHARDLHKTIALFLAALLAGCAGNPVPKGWRPPPVKAQRGTHGGWILIERTGDWKVAGELIAVNDRMLYVLTVSGFRSVPRPAVGKVRLVGYGTAEYLWLWTAVGAVSTISHGRWFYLTLPIWVIGGPVANSREKKAAFVPPDNFASFARFPQGLPPGFDPASLGPLTQEAVPPDAEFPQQFHKR